MQQGKLVLELQSSATRVETSHPEVETLVGGERREVRHEQAILLSETRLGAAYGATDHVAIALSFPVRVVASRIAYVDPATGQEVQVAEEIHHRDETLVGVGDPWLVARGTWTLGGFVLDGRAGISVPLGRTEEDPFALGAMGLRHQHIQFGTGTFNPVLGLAIARPFSGWRLGLWGFAQLILYENDKGYRAGDRFAAGVLASSRLGTQRWSFRVGLEAQREDAERWGGATHDEGNLGRTDLLASAGVAFAVTRRVVVHAGVQVPLVTEVEGGQLEVPLIGTLGVEVAWERARPAEPHRHDEAGHEHGEDDDHHEDGGDHAPAAVDWTGVDLEHVGSPGEAVELVPVPGKITVFDFWATWCEPCKVLDREVSELARRYPDRIAVRKIDVVNWESPAAKRFLVPRSYSLPHIKVYGPDGELLFEKSAGPLILRGKIEEALER